MARRIIWSKLALDVYNKILEFYNQRNGNKVYSRKLNREIKHTISLLKKQPNLGKVTQIDNIKVLIHGDYKIIYEIRRKEIIITMVWDTRQYPEKLNIKNIVSSTNNTG